MISVGLTYDYAEAAIVRFSVAKPVTNITNGRVRLLYPDPCQGCVQLQPGARGVPYMRRVPRLSIFASSPTTSPSIPPLARATKHSPSQPSKMTEQVRVHSSRRAWDCLGARIRTHEEDAERAAVLMTAVRCRRRTCMSRPSRRLLRRARRCRTSRRPRRRASPTRCATRMRNAAPARSHAPSPWDFDTPRALSSVS